MSLTLTLKDLKPGHLYETQTGYLIRFNHSVYDIAYTDHGSARLSALLLCLCPATHEVQYLGASLYKGTELGCERFIRANRWGIRDSLITLNLDTTINDLRDAVVDAARFFALHKTPEKLLAAVQALTLKEAA
jgi:hypothetical protein